MAKSPAAKDKCENPTQGWKTALLGVVVGALLVGSSNYILWTQQHSSELADKLYDTRVQIMNNLISYCLDYQRLRPAKVTYVMARDALANGKPAPSLEEKREVEKKLEELMPKELRDALKSEEAFSKMMSSLALAQVFFGPNTRAAAKEYIAVLMEDVDEIVGLYISEEIEKGKDPDKVIMQDDSGRYLVQVGTHRIEKLVLQRMEKKFTAVLECMRDELGIL